MSDDPLTEYNSWADLEFDGYSVGQVDDTSGQAIKCERESDDGPLARLVSDDRWPEDPSEWVVEDSIQVGMDLELPGAGREATIELTIGDAVYRSDVGTRTTIKGRPGDDGVYRGGPERKVRIDGVVGGRAVFRDIPLERGTPFEGKQRLERLVITWDCLGRADIW